MITNKIIDYLDSLIPNPKCELIYNKDYELLIATMLSAQTTDKRVNEVTKILFDKYPTLTDLKNASLSDIKEIVKPLGSYNIKSKNVISIADKLEPLGYVPNDRVFLESLSGVGRKTANVVLSNIYDVPLIAVDTHVSRVSKRLGLASNDDDVLKIEQKLNKKFPKDKLSRLHHQLVLFGRYYCKAKKPLCENCKLKSICNYDKTVERDEYGNKL